MEETLKKVSSEITESVDKTVTLYVQSRLFVLNGYWKWEMQSHAVYCSDVIFFPENFEGTKGIIHPDDVYKIKGALELLHDEQTLSIEFRIITTYGEVKNISGQRLIFHEPVKGQKLNDVAPWQTAIEPIVTRHEAEFFELRTELSDVAEKLYNTGTWFINKSTGQAWYSDNVYRIYGLPVQSLNPHANTFNSFIYADDRVKVIDAFEHAYNEEVPLHIEYRILHQDGTIRYVSVITRWSVTKNGNPMFSGVIRDITEERLSDEYLTTTEARAKLNQQVLNYSEQQASIGYWYMNLVTRKVNYSDNYLRIYGLKGISSPNINTFLELVHPDDKETVRQILDKMYREHSLPETEFRIIRPDGKQRYLRQTGKVFILNDNQLMMGIVVQDITVIKGLEKKIGELSETINLQNLTNQVAEDVAGLSSVLWLEDGLMRWSDGFFKLLGYKPGSVEPMQRLFHRAIHPEDVKTFRDAELLVLNNQEHADIQFRIISKASIRQLNLSFRRIKYANKEVALGLVQDITTQSQFQKQVLEAIRLSELIGDAINDIIILTDTNYNITTWNAAAEEKTGVKKEDALHHNFFDIFPLLNNEFFLHHLQAVLKGMDVTIAQAKQGYLRTPHNYYMAPLKNEKEEVIGILHVVQDISKELELQAQLSERLNFIENLVEATVDRIVVLDRHMNYLYWNRKAEEYYSIKKEKILGKNILEVFPSFRNDPSYTEFRKALRGETVYIPASAQEESDEYFETYLVPIKNEIGEVTAVLWIVHDLSKELLLNREKAKSDEEIKQKAHFLSRITDTVPDMISITNLETREFDYLNKEVFRRQGFDPDVMNARSREELFEYIHQDDREQVAEYFQSFSSASDEDIITTEYRSKDDNGEWKWFLVRGRVFQRNKEGVVTHILNVIENITEKKNAETEIVKTKENLELALSGAHAGCGWWNIKTGEASWDDKGKNLVGLSEEESKTAIAWLDKIHPDDRQKVIEHANECAREGKDFNMEYRVIKNGEERYFLGTGHFMKNEKGEAEEVYGLVIDITDRKRVEQEILRLKDISNASLENFKRITDSAHDAIISLDVHGRVIYWNHAAENLYGYEEKNVVGKPLTELIVPPSKLAEIARNRERIYRGETIVDLETQRINKEGKLIDVLISIFPLKDNENIIGVCGIVKDITERKNWEEEIKKNLTILQHAESIAQMGSWEYEIATGKFNWSEGMYHLFKLPQQVNVHPETYLEFVADEDRSIAKRIINNLRKKHEPFEEVMKIKRGREQRLIKIKGSVVTGENGTVQKIIGIDLDITDIYKAEEKLKESQRWLEHTAAASPDSIIVYDLQKKQPVFLNNRLAEWIGVSNEDLLGIDVTGRLKLVHPDDRLNLLHHNEKTAAAKDGEVVTIEYRISTSDEKIIWIRNRSKPFQRNNHGKVTHILSVLQNVTEEINLRNELKRRTQYAEAIIDSSIDRIFVLDRNHTIIAWNKRSEEITGVRKEQAIGKNIFQLFPKLKEDAVINEAYADALHGNYVHLPAKRAIYANIMYERFFIPLKNGNDVYAILCLMHDVSEMISKSEELNELNKTLEEKNKELEQKNEEITSFAFVASHDLREPLRKIHTFSDWLLQKETGNLSQRGKEYINRMDNSVKRLNMLIDDIMLITKIHSEGAKLHEVSLEHVFKQVVNDLDSFVNHTKARIKIGPLPTIQADSNQLFYLFRNLLDNALKFQPPGQQPVIRIKSEIIEAGVKETVALKPGREYLEVSIEDNGLGFEARFKKKIFQVFQQLRDGHQFSGTGMGLAICKKIMENHEGVITADGKLGEGSTFCCYFPL